MHSRNRSKSGMRSSSSLKPSSLTSLGGWVLALVLCIPSICSGESLYQQAATLASGNCVNYPRVASDGSGSSYVVWQTCDVPHCQRLEADGSVAWALGARPVRSHGPICAVPRIVSSSMGSAIAIWPQAWPGQSGDIFAQGLSPAGDMQWTSDGVAVTAAPDWQWDPDAVSDGMGGAYVVWRDERLELRVQHLGAGGALLFGASGVLLSDVPARGAPVIDSDGQGGMVAAWMDARNHVWSYYAQRVGPDGQLLWGHAGTPIRLNPLSSHGLSLVTDGVGGAYVGWIEFVESFGARYAHLQHVNAQGVSSVADSDLVIAPQGLEQSGLILAHDQENHVLAAWSEVRRGQPLDSVLVMATEFWPPDGGSLRRTFELAWGHSYRGRPALCGLSRGFLVSWEDERVSVGAHALFLQYVIDGQCAWSGGGVKISSGSSVATLASLAAIGPNAAVVAWVENDDVQRRIVAKRFDAGVATAARLSFVSLERDGQALELRWWTAERCRGRFALESSFDGGPWIRRECSGQNESGYITARTDVAAGCQSGQFRLLELDDQGNPGFIHEAVLLSLGVGGELPVAFALGAVTPNPSAQQCALALALPRASRVTAHVYDAAGRRVRELSNRSWDAGSHTLAWDLADQSGARVHDGLYFVRVEAGGLSWTKRVAVIH